ncbi:MAG: hypothetical protein V4529_17175 [Gemmatimonadota bacterium]
MTEAALTQIDSMDEILSSDDVEFVTIEGFTKNKPFRIGSLTAGDLIEWSEANEGEAKRTAGLRLICKSLVNSKNERFASDSKNIAVFRLKSHKVTERIVKEILALNGMVVKDAEKAKNA